MDVQGDSVSPARERLGYKPRDDDDVQKNLSISFCLAFVSLPVIPFLSFQKHSLCNRSKDKYIGHKTIKS